MNTPIKSLLKDREEEYGDAWFVGGETLGFLQGPLGGLIRKAPQYAYAWITILNKLIRACKTPYEIDHWVDIQGYAKLVADDIHDNKHKWKEQPDGNNTTSAEPDTGASSDADS